MKIEIILYVRNQAMSAEFYQKLLHKAPDLDVPGMTEFILGDHCKLGLMPTSGFAKILGNRVPHPDKGYGIPRCELYLNVQDVNKEFEYAVSIGAIVVSPVAIRNWGDKVGYIADMDGHIIAFASTIPSG
jgi:lactoylglutathione lyase